MNYNISIEQERHNKLVANYGSRHRVSNILDMLIIIALPLLCHCSFFAQLMSILLSASLQFNQSLPYLLAQSGMDIVFYPVQLRLSHRLSS